MDQSNEKSISNTPGNEDDDSRDSTTYLMEPKKLVMRQFWTVGFIANK